MTQTPTFTVLNGYDRKPMVVRNPADLGEMVSHCQNSTHVWTLDRVGHARRVKINGRVRTWKRNPNRVEIPYKYGLYEYGTFDASDIDRVLIPEVA